MRVDVGPGQGSQFRDSQGGVAEELYNVTLTVPADGKDLLVFFRGQDPLPGRVHRQHLDPGGDVGDIVPLGTPAVERFDCRQVAVGGPPGASSQQLVEVGFDVLDSDVLETSGCGTGELPEDLCVLLLSSL